MLRHESICSELTVAQKKWHCLGIYRPPASNILASFFEELTDNLSKGSKFYENFIIGDFNINIKVAGRGLDKPKEFCDLFSLTNLIRKETFFTRDHTSTIDLILTNTPKNLQNTCITETGLSDFHQLILTFFKTKITRLKPNIVFYHNYKHFEDSRFREDLNSKDFSLNTYDQKENYNFITDKFINVVNRHVPLKEKTLRGNQAPFLTKELRKEIYTRSKLKNRYNRNPTEENKAIYKKQRNKCASLRQKSIKMYFNNVTKTGIQTNKDF